MEVSAKTGQNIQEAFKTMVVEIYRRQNKGAPLPPPKNPQDKDDEDKN